MAGKSLSGLRGFVRSIGEEPVWIGVDVHKVKYHVALVTVGGSGRTWSCAADPKGFVKQLKELGIKVALVVYEAGPTGFSLARALEASGVAVAVVAPSRVMRPVSAGAKTDRLDCLKLAELGMRGMLKPIAVPSKEEEAIRSLNRRSHELTDRIRKVKGRIKSHLLFLEVEEPAGLSGWSRSSISALAKLELSLGAALTLESLVRELKGQMEEREWVWEKLRELLEVKEERKDVSNLRTIPGVGPITARTFCLELFRPGRFNRAEEVSSYLGLAPMVRHSGLGKPGIYQTGGAKEAAESLGGGVLDLEEVRSLCPGVLQPHLIPMRIGPEGDRGPGPQTGRGHVDNMRGEKDLQTGECSGLRASKQEYINLNTVAEMAWSIMRRSRKGGRNQVPNRYSAHQGANRKRETKHNPA